MVAWIAYVCVMYDALTNALNFVMWEKCSLASTLNESQIKYQTPSTNYLRWNDVPEQHIQPYAMHIISYENGDMDTLRTTSTRTLCNSV